MKWFKHMSDLRFYAPIRRLTRKFGVEGYGLYMYFLESATHSIEIDQPIPRCEETFNDISAELHIDVDRIHELTDLMKRDGLVAIERDTGKVIMISLVDRLDEYFSKKGGKAIIQEALSYIVFDELQSDSGDVPQEEKRTDQEESRKEIEKNQNKGEEDIAEKHHFGYLKNVLLTNVQYQQLVQLGIGDSYIDQLGKLIETESKEYKDHFNALRALKEIDLAKEMSA